MKKKAGQNSVNNIKTSSFLPKVFQTELNKTWLDSTMDQMVSKGPLENISGFVGSKDGKIATANDTYITTDFNPAIVSYNKEKQITNLLAFDDVTNSINENFKTYNYNSAYNSAKFSFSPPIDIDKFTNHKNYSWVEELPVYESILASGSVNPITEIQTNNKSTIVDDNNTVVLENQMLIKFTGAGWDTAVTDKTYIVAGTNGKFSLYEYIDENGVRVYNNTVKHTENTDGTWINDTLFNVNPNWDSKYFPVINAGNFVIGQTYRINNRTTTDFTSIGATDNNIGTVFTATDVGTGIGGAQLLVEPSIVVGLYNADGVKEPVFDGFYFNDVDNNPTKLVYNTLVKFTGDWASTTDTTNVYATEYKVDVIGINLTLATADEVATIPVISPASNLMYDKGYIVAPIKDYIVVAKNDNAQTAWSRNNHWVNISTIKKLIELMPDYDFSDIESTHRKASRPIIEYNPELHMWNQTESTSNNSYKGVVDEAVTSGNEPTTVGKTYVYTDGTDTLIHTVGSSDITLSEGNTFSVLASTDSEWVEADGYYTNNKITLAQQKTQTNQTPLYRFYNEDGEALESVNGKRFIGDKIFGYKVGTGINDPELGFPLSYKDTPKGAEYEFENFIITQKYHTTYSNAENSRGTYSKDQVGYSLFKQNNILKNVYIPAGEMAGAEEHIQYKVEASDLALTIPYGKNNWRPEQKYLIHNNENNLSITTVADTGDSTTKESADGEVMLLGVDQQVTFKSLSSMTLSLVSHGTTITDNTPDWIDTYTSSAAGIILKTSTLSNNTRFDLVANGNTVIQTFVVSEQWDSLFYRITVDGKQVSQSDLTINGTTININENALNKNSLVDLYFRNVDLTNKTTNNSLPDVHKHNANNNAIETFTLSETVDHWANKLNTLPGFDGKVFEENNYQSIPHTAHYGGTIFMHKDISIMHDINYSSNELSVTGALVEQANEFVAFRQRVSAQARRIWSVGASTVQELADNAIYEVTRNQQDHGLYKESNMLYIKGEDYQTFTLEGDAITDFPKTFETRFLINGDKNIRDHVYVYLTEDNGSETQIRRLLLKDTDYTFIGKKITLTLDYASYDSLKTKPTLEVYYTHMDEQSFVPASMVKLGLAYGVEPQVDNNILYTHDGKEIDVTGQDLVNINAPTFNPVNAVIFEMEKRIFAGLVKQDAMYKDEAQGRTKYSAYNNYLPSQHRHTWHSLSDLDNYLEKHYYKWAKQNSITSFNTPNYYEANNSFTWNYSTITVNNGLENQKLPGHWKGAYMMLFGTCTPHITPWHMLGYSFKPTWWDNEYNWDTKRDELIEALQRGTYTNPTALKQSQDINVARHYWDWDNCCPVNNAGELRDPKFVLDPSSTLSNVDKEQDFVFGDWGPVEYEWRASALGQAVTVDAVLKLNPAKAWTDFFQPGQSQQFLTSNFYKTPGNIYGNSIEYIKVNSSPSTLESEGSFVMLDDDYSTIGAATYDLTEAGTPGKINAISVTDRGLNFTTQHIVSYVPYYSELPTGIDLYTKLKPVSFVANGIAQAQFNFMIRHSFDTKLDNLHDNLTTKLQTKLNGFTSKHLLNINAETSNVGDFQLGADDFSVEMYQGTTAELVTASTLTIKKTLTGYTVSGNSNNAREFNFYEPNLVLPTAYTTKTILNQSVRHYDKFVTTPSVIEYDAELQKLQDVYNFIRGYWKWMDTVGYIPEYDGNSSASDFVAWAFTAEVGEGYILQLGRVIKYKPASGHVYEYNKLEYNSNDVLDSDGTRLDNTKLSIKRIDGTTTIETKQQEFIGSITSAVLNYQHVILFENKTKLAVHIFDDVKNISQKRLHVSGQRTQNWTGEKKAPGYLIAGNSIVQNFDSAVESINDIYRTDVDEFNKTFAKGKDLTLGKSEGMLLDGLGINDNVLTKYYQGMIREKGTKGAIEHVGKSTILNNGETKVSAYEQYMFRQSTLGNDDLEDPLEIEIVSSDITSSPQAISLEPTGTQANVINATLSKIVNDKDITFETLSYDDSESDILTGGEPLFIETDYRSLTMPDMPSVFDTEADYNKIPTWNASTSYQLGDKVRYQGQLWKCNVDFTGLTLAQDTIVVNGTATYPTFEYGTQAIIAGTTTTLEKTNPYWTDVVAEGTAISPTFKDTETLFVDGVQINFDKKIGVPTIIGPAIILADANGRLLDTTDRSITIAVRNTNTGDTDTTINFDYPDVTETFSGDATETTFTITQSLGGAIGDNYEIQSVTVDGVAVTDPTDYSVSGQDITFVSAPAIGTNNVVVVLNHITFQLTQTQIKDKINAANITNLTCTIENVGSIDRLQLSYQDTDVNNSLVLKSGSGPHGSNNYYTNSELGFITSPTENEAIVVAQQKQNQSTSVDMTVNEIAGFINANSDPAMANITATVDSNKIVITKNNNTSVTNLYFSGTACALLGITTGTTDYINIEQDVPVPADLDFAIDKIKITLANANITNVIVSRVANALSITSTAASLTLGDTSFNSSAGIVTGTVFSNSTNVSNTFTDTKTVDGVETPHFTVIDPSQDSALFSVLVSDDSDYSVATVGGINTKFYSWNVFQAQQSAVPLFTKPDPALNTPDNFTTCGICAGTTSSDGNDAEVTTNIDHGLKVGSYVMLLNTTTTPNIDGIHKITKLGEKSNVFYIDEFIESCGNAVSVLPLVTTRFASKDQRETALLSNSWNIPTGKVVFANTNPTGTEQLRGTYVRTIQSYDIHSAGSTIQTGQYYKILSVGDTDFTTIGAGANTVGTIFVSTGIGSGTGTAMRVASSESRRTTTRPTNRDIDSMVIYNHTNNQAKVQLEAWDPMRKILPGIARQNIDYINHSDNAIYNTSTDVNQHIDLDTSWGNDQVGTRWWDISKVRYVDYDQGDAQYKTNHWGRQESGSEIVVWEWIKSTVAPDDYDEEVGKNTEMFGTVATGEAFSYYDQVAKETQYYYTTEEEWNEQTLSYKTVYYFWVKNKTTLTDTRSLSAYEASLIIDNPTANGVSWFAVISEKEFLIDNINYYVEDKNTVVQINKAGDKFKSHNEWTVITKDSDVIPEYYIDRLKRNLGGRNDNKDKIPFISLHRFNRYGDDLEIGQAWFNNLPDARRNAIVTINSILKNINLVDEYQDTWDVTLLANQFPANLWRWTDYVLPTYNGTLNHTTIINKYSDLDSIDRTKHLVARLTLFHTELQLNRTETYAYNKETDKWDLVFKKNSTIEFDEGLMTATGGWDTTTFDSRPWDEADIAEYWETLVEALYKDIFVYYHRDKMNVFFFAMVHYILSVFEQTNWIRKTTYVKLEFTDALETKIRKYTKNKINNVLGYVQEVKPFHTKSSTIVTKHTALENANLTLTEEPATNITVKVNDYEALFGGTLFDDNSVNNVAIEDLVTGTEYVITSPDNSDFTLVGATDSEVGTIFTATGTGAGNGQAQLHVGGTGTNIINGIDFNDAKSFNYITGGFNRNSLVEVKPLEQLVINVQTNATGSTHASTSRTFAHIHQANNNVIAYGLTEAKQDELNASFSPSDDTITVLSTANFDDSGIVYIDGELIEYTKHNSTTLNVIKHGVAGTFGVTAIVGASVIQVNDTQLTFANGRPSHYEYNTIGDTILNSPGSTQAQELQTFGKGVEL